MIRHLRAIEMPIRIVGIDVQNAPDVAADRVLQIDLSDTESIKQALQLEAPNIVVHLAGLMPPADENQMMAANVDASVNLLKCIQELKTTPTRVICAGSASEYGSASDNPSEESGCKPTTAYGTSKYIQTSRSLSFNSQLLEIIVARPFNLIGPGLSENLVAGGLLKQFLSLTSSKDIVIPKGPVESIRDFIDVRDVVSAYWKLATTGRAGHLYNVCTGKGTSIAELIAMMQRRLGKHAVIVPDYDSTKVSADTSIGQNRKLAALGWQPRHSVDESVNAMIDAATTSPARR